MCPRQRKQGKNEFGSMLTVGDLCAGLAPAAEASFLMKNQFCSGFHNKFLLWNESFLKVKIYAERKKLYLIFLFQHPAAY